MQQPIEPRGDFFCLVEPDLMDLGGCHVGGSRRVQRRRVERFAVAELPQARVVLRHGSHGMGLCNLAVERGHNVLRIELCSL